MKRKKSETARAERLEGIIVELEKKYGEAPLALNFTNGLELLIAVILSAQCTDERVNKVTVELFERCRSVEDFVAIDQEELEAIVRPTGFFRNKAKSVKTCCEALRKDHGGEIPKLIDQLVKLPGVGRKTAAMVLGNAYGIHQGIAVDTHVKRVAQRLGFTEAKTPDKIERDLMGLVPGARWTWFSNAVILHGRETCTARKPKCFACSIERFCPYDEKTPG